MRRGRRSSGGAVLLAVLACLLPVGGCARSVDGAPTAGAGEPLPASAEDLGALVLTEVPSGLRRLPDDGLMPPAGAKRVEDVAGYARDPARERAVLQDYGYRHGWERFWGSQDGPLTSVFVDQFEHRAGAGAYAEDPRREREVLEDYGYRFGWERFWGHGEGPVTSVFVDQFEHRAGAGAYAADLASNDADHYGGMLRESPSELPRTCQSLTLDDPDPGLGLDGPAAFAWCAHGVFSVAVTVIADSVDAAEAEMRDVVAGQLDRLPPR